MSLIIEMNGRNMQSVRDTLFEFTPLSRFLSLGLFLGYFGTLLVPAVKRYLELIPGKASFAIWTCATSSFLVLNPLELLVDIVVLLFVGQIVEPVLGVVGLLKLLLFVASATGFATFAAAYTTFVIGRSVSALYIHISGFHGLTGAMLVCLKQVAPDHTIIFFDVFTLRAEWLASVYVVLGIPVGLLYTPLNFYPFLIFGTYFAWFYLRFLQIDERTHLRGDPSPSFKFASFFPERLRPSVNAVASFCSRVFHIRNKQPVQPAYPPASSHPFQHDPFDQARRRERGQKALDARLRGMNGGEAPELETVAAEV